MQRKEATYLDSENAQSIVKLLFAEDDIRIKTFILLLLYSGVRRGELCGLEWQDVDRDNNLSHIRRASQYQRGRGVTQVPTRTKSSERAIKLPDIMFDVLAEYRIWWASRKLSLGDSWKGASDRLFVQSDGKPTNSDTLNYWLNQLIEKHKLPHFTPHSCRHTFASIQIANGVDIRTLQVRTGQAQALTLVNIYSHVVKQAAEAASDKVNDVLTPQSMKKA